MVGAGLRHGHATGAVAPRALLAAVAATPPLQSPPSRRPMRSLALAAIWCDPRHSHRCCALAPDTSDSPVPAEPGPGERAGRRLDTNAAARVNARVFLKNICEPKFSGG